MFKYISPHSHTILLRNDDSGNTSQDRVGSHPTRLDRVLQIFSRNPSSSVCNPLIKCMFFDTKHYFNISINIDKRFKMLYYIST